MEVLTGHDSPEDAYVIHDYPYGFRLRCEMRVWIETNKQGQRVWRQTSNPKKPGTWNKAKASTYSPIVLLRLNDEGHVETFGPHIYGEVDELIGFEQSFFEYLTNWQRNTLAYLIAGKRAMQRVTFSVHTHEYSFGEKRPACEKCDAETYQQQRKREDALISGLVRDELRQESDAALAGEEFDRARASKIEEAAQHYYNATHAAALPDEDA